jgi:hypothetical protein
MNNHIEVTGKIMDTNQVNKQAKSTEPRADLQDAAIVMAQMFGETLAYCEADDAWLRWTGTHWQDTGRSKTELDRMAVEALRQVGVNISGAGKVDGTIRLAKALMRRELVAPPSIVVEGSGT